MAICSPTSLLSSAAAFQALDPRSQLICAAQLLCDISTASSGGGGIFITGNPNGQGPTTTMTQGIAYDAIGNMWVKTNSANDDQGWEQFVSASAPLQVPMMEMPSREMTPVQAVELPPDRGGELVLAGPAPQLVKIIQPAQTRWFDKVKSWLNLFSF